MYWYLDILKVVKKQIWVAQVVFVLLAAYLTANIVSMQIASVIETGTQLDISSLSSVKRTPKPEFEEYQVILDRNVFNSAAAGLEKLKKMAGNLGINISLADLDLIGTMAGEPEVSLAVISKKSDGGKAGIYRWGDMLGDYEITAIERKQVRLEKDGAEEILKMPDERKAFAFNADVEEVGKGIKKVGDDQMVVDRSVIDESFDNFGKLMRQARIVPHLQGGKIDGFKIYRIKDKSLFKQIGLTNGDVIKRVNGSEIQGPEDALKLFEIFKTAKSISIDLERKGAKKTLSYSVR